MASIFETGQINPHLLLPNSILKSQMSKLIQNIGLFAPDLLHRYAYVSNNPANWVDPWGLEKSGETRLLPLPLPGGPYYYYPDDPKRVYPYKPKYPGDPFPKTPPPPYHPDDPLWLLPNPDPRGPGFQEPGLGPLQNPINVPFYRGPGSGGGGGFPVITPDDPGDYWWRKRF